MVARAVLPLVGVLLLVAGAWLLGAFPIDFGWFGWGQPGDASAPDVTARLSVMTQVALVSLVGGGALVGAAIGFALGRRRPAPLEV